LYINVQYDIIAGILIARKMGTSAQKWSLLAKNGHCCPKMVTAGQKWSLLAKNGHCCPKMAILM
jgi:hypothetical protein